MFEPWTPESHFAALDAAIDAAVELAKSFDAANNKTVFLRNIQEWRPLAWQFVETLNEIRESHRRMAVAGGYNIPLRKD